MSWFKDRSNEASTWGGLGMMIVGLGSVFDVDEAGSIAGTVEAAGQAFASGMPWWQAVALALAGIAMSFKSDGDRGF